MSVGNRDLIRLGIVSRPISYFLKFVVRLAAIDCEPMRLSRAQVAPVDASATYCTSCRTRRDGHMTQRPLASYDSELSFVPSRAARSVARLALHTPSPGLSLMQHRAALRPYRQTKLHSVLQRHGRERSLARLHSCWYNISPPTFQTPIIRPRPPHLHILPTIRRAREVRVRRHAELLHQRPRGLRVVRTARRWRKRHALHRRRRNVRVAIVDQLSQIEQEMGDQDRRQSAAGLERE